MVFFLDAEHNSGKATVFYNFVHAISLEIPSVRWVGIFSI